jgi:hypothetical protein
MPRLDDPAVPDVRPPPTGSAWLRRLRSRRPLETVLVLLLVVLVACAAAAVLVLVSLPALAALSSPIGPALPHPGASR